MGSPLRVGLRSLYSVYEQVSLINLNDRTVVALYQDSDAIHKLPTGNLCLRVISHRGSYEWKSFQLVRIRANIYYLLIRSAESEVQELRSAYHMTGAVSDRKLSPTLLWENVVNNADLKFFWKDRERRFVGASRSFMEHYAFQSPAEFVGKTDEDMGWHVHNDPFRDEEWKVINEGVTSRRAVGSCLVQGENRDIVASKMPLFSQDGKIVGLIGYFFETGGSTSASSGVLQARTDALTGLLNSRGLYEDMFAYIDEFQLRGRDFARIEIAIDGIADINARYGYDFGDAVIRETGHALRRDCGNTATVGRISGCMFTVLRQFEKTEELDALIERIRAIPSQLNEIDGVPFNMYLSVGMALYSETRNLDSMAAQAEMRRMTDDVENISQHQLMENTGRIFHMFDELPLSYAVYKIVPGPEGVDAIVLYANKKFTEMSEFSAGELIGRRVSSFFALNANRWINMAEEAGVEGKSVTRVFHHAPLNMDFSITAYPVIGPGFCAFTFQTVEKQN